MTSPVSVLLHLQHRAREAASVDELGFIMVNETHGMIPYRQGALWLEGKGVAALSGVSAPEHSAPFGQWLERSCRDLAAQMSTSARIDPAILSARNRDEWGEWLPHHGLWLVLNAPAGRRLGALLLARDEAWDDGDLPLLMEACHAYGHALAYYLKPGKTASWRPNRMTWGIGALAIAVVAARAESSTMKTTHSIPQANTQ